MFSFSHEVWTIHDITYSCYTTANYQELDSTQCEVRGSRCHVFSRNYCTQDNFMYHFLCNRGILCCKLRRQKVWHVVNKIVDDDRLQKVLLETPKYSENYQTLASGLMSWCENHSILCTNGPNNLHATKKSLAPVLLRSWPNCPFNEMFSKCTCLKARNLIAGTEEPIS